MPHLCWGDAAGLGLPKKSEPHLFFCFSACWAERFFGSSKRFFGGPLIVAGREVVRASVLVLSGAVGSRGFVELGGAAWGGRREAQERCVSERCGGGEERGSAAPPLLDPKVCVKTPGGVCGREPTSTDLSSAAA